MSHLKSLSNLRKDAEHIFYAGINAEDSYLAVKRCLQFDGKQLICKLNLNISTLEHNMRYKYQRIC